VSYIFASKNGSPENPYGLISADKLAFDIEGSGVNIGTSVPYGFSLAYEPNSAYYVHIDDQQLKGLLADESKLKIPFNAAYDRSMLKKAGVTIDNLCDPMIAAHLLGNSELSLKALALKYLGLNVVSFKELGRNIVDMTLPELLEYSGPHSMAAFMLWGILEEELRKLKLLDVFWNIEMPFVPVLSDMEFNGVAVDRNTLDQLGGVFDEKIAILADGLDYWAECTGMNHNSPDQVANLLFNKLKLPAGRPTRTGDRPSVDKRYLATIVDKHPYIRPYLLFKEYKTLKHSYVDSLRKKIVDDRVYGSFNQARTRTGRLSSSDPNLQKIPQRTAIGRKIREAFVAPEGQVLMKWDYDLFELKGLAHVSQDPALLAAFREKVDIHTATAIRVYGSKDERPKAKTLDFRITYGGGEAKDRAAFFEMYPGALEWIKRTNAEAREAGYIRTIGGRIRDIPELWSTYPKIQQHGDREVISTIIQGSTAEVVKIGMRRFWDEVKDSDVKIVLQVHDEMVLQAPENLVDDITEVLNKTMTYNEWSLPLTGTISIGKNWGEMKEIASVN